MAYRFACLVATIVIAVVLVALGMIIINVLSSAAQCGGDLLSNCR
jgi:hypothetical protein